MYRTKTRVYLLVSMTLSPIRKILCTVK